MRGRFIPLVAVAALAGGCARVPEHGGALAQVQQADVTSRELQTRTYELGRHFASVIELTADSIAARSTDPAVARHALEWKVAGVPLAHEASLRHDPVVAVVDVWAFAVQQRNYFADGDGRDAFGPEQPTARAAAERLIDDAKGLITASLTSHTILPETITTVTEWAAEHPIRGEQFARPSISAYDWKLFESEDARLAASVGNIERSISEVTNRLAIIDEELFKQARWNVQLMAGDALSAADGPKDSLLRTLGTLNGTLQSASRLMDGTPDLLTAQREAAFEAIARERKAAFQALGSEREAVLAALTREREALLAAIREERIGTLQSADSITQRSIDHVAAALERIIWRLAVLAGVLVVILAGLAAALFRAIWRRRPAGAEALRAAG